MFRKILYPTDFSLHSEKILDFIPNLKPAGLQEVILLHVIDKRLFNHFPEVSPDIVKEIRSNASNKMSKVKESLEKLGIKTEEHIETGIPFHQIVGVAQARSVSMIVMGSHGKSLIEEMLLGSTTENVIRHATVPLLVIKLRVKKKGDEIICSYMHKNLFEKILFPTDFSECSLSVLPFLKQLKAFGTKEIIVVHVQDMTRLAPHLLDKLPEFEDIDTERLSKIKNDLLSAGIPGVKTILKEGVPFVEIENIADAENVGMIALGSHGKSMVKEILLGSVSGRTVRRTRRPVLLIRRK